MILPAVLIEEKKIMAKFFSDVTAGGILSCIGNVFGKKQGYVDQSPTAYQAEITGSSNFVQRQSSNVLLYAGLGGIGLLMMVLMMKK